MKPVCVPCQRFFRMVKSGFYFTEGMPIVGRPEPGTADSECWGPYKLWVGDKWRCEGCGAEILSGFGREPLNEHYKPDFADMRTRLGAEYQVNDC